MQLHYRCYSKHYNRWFHTQESDSCAHFIFFDGKLLCHIWDKFDIVEIIDNFEPAVLVEKTA